MTIGLTWRFLDDSTFLMSSHNCFPWSEFFEYHPLILGFSQNLADPC